MNILIVEDDLKISEYLNTLFEEAFPKALIHQAYSLADAEKFLQKTQYPLISIDLMLPDGNGFEFVKKHKAAFADNETEYFIISGMYDIQTAFFAYDEMHCFKMLPKPIIKEDFLAAIDRFKSQYEKHGQSLYFSHQNKFISLRIPYEEILYFEVTLKNCSLHTMKATYDLGRVSIKSIMAQLSENDFVQIHRSIVANLNHIRLIQKSTSTWEVAMSKPNLHLPVGIKFQESLYKRYQEVSQ